eukprot:CAMPEP_0118640844 /NCGR_PEP_ID=MMETSP0785-20121206/4965_1 /TAXON_ID=91992 /ORGANISM="Bolidomonas pacifica, Strain CCMP 1866" /LENGTH=66 /DNA_ID=CAMNT_0006532249 /DNA_START=184 /DNA_END=381 /DNA_ORIENTATION=+
MSTVIRARLYNLISPLLYVLSISVSSLIWLLPSFLRDLLPWGVQEMIEDWDVPDWEAGGISGGMMG